MIKKHNLVRFINSRRWASFAKAYNGSGYRANKYDTNSPLLFSAGKLRWRDLPDLSLTRATSAALSSSKSTGDEADAVQGRPGPYFWDGKEMQESDNAGLSDTRNRSRARCAA